MTTNQSSFKFILITALLMSTVAFSIDAILPAFPKIKNYFSVENSNSMQRTIHFIFLGLAIGQLFFGPISDIIGRKKAIYLGTIIFCIGISISLFANNFTTFLMGRLIQGVGLSAQRTISLALVRDRFKGNEMAKIMSFIMAIFILIPIIAPSFGQLLISFFGWKSIFYFLLIFISVVVFFMAMIIPETLKKENIVQPTFNYYKKVITEIFKNKTTILSTISSGLILGAFITYLSTSQQVFQIKYQLSEQFPLVFAGLALTVGITAVINGRLVERFGLNKIVYFSLSGLTIIGLIFTTLHFIIGDFSLLITIFFYVFSLGFVGLLLGNLNTLAMIPMGSYAGLGATIIGSISTFISVIIGQFIGVYFNNSMFPIVLGFLASGMISFLLLSNILKSLSSS